MTVQSFTGTIDTNGQFETVESLTGITFTADTNYSIQVQNIADIKIADAIFTVHNEKFQYKAGTEDIYIKTNEKVTLTISEGTASGGGTPYVLPIASETTLGGVKIDGETITITEGGVISSQGGGGGTSDHAQLTNLDYANSGHTGFMSSSNHIEPNTIITVGSGKDYAKIQDALNFLAGKWCEGEVKINIDAGTYNEQLVLNSSNLIKTISITGNSMSDTIVNFTPPTGWQSIFSISNQSTVNLKNLTFQSVASDNSIGIIVTNSYIIASNITIKNTSYSALNIGVNSLFENKGGVTITNAGTNKGSKAVLAARSGRYMVTTTSGITSINNFDIGIFAEGAGICALNLGVMPTFTSVTTNYSPALNNMTAGTGWIISSY